MALEADGADRQNSPAPGAVPEDPGGLERRREARYPTNDPAEIRILPLSGPRLPSTVIDVSRSGLRLEVSTQLARGLQVEVVLPAKAAVFGEVRYCRRAGDAFHVGIRIQDVHYSRSGHSEHVPEEQLLLYVQGNGLKALEVMRVRDHLEHCPDCRVRVEQKASSTPKTA